jgi:ribosomal protein S18 acetylase RimI-like enzyme
MGKSRDSSRNRLGQIQGLAVSPVRLRRGIGARLIDVAERFVSAAGYRGIYADTPVTNEGGRAFYRSRGYTEDYRMTRYYSDDLDGVTLVKFFADRNACGRAAAG